MVFLGFAKTEIGEFHDAITCYTAALEIQDHLETNAMIGYSLAKKGDVDEARDVIARLLDLKKQRFVPSSFIAIIYAALEETDSAINALNDAWQEEYLDLVALRVDPRWSTIREDKRFKNLVKNIGI